MVDNQYCQKNHVCHNKVRHKMCPDQGQLETLKNRECYYNFNFGHSIKYIQCLNRKDVEEDIFSSTVFSQAKRYPLLNSLEPELKFNGSGLWCNGTFLRWNDKETYRTIFNGEVFCTSKMEPGTLARLIEKDLTFKQREFVQSS